MKAEAAASALRKVRDWKGLERWCRDHQLPLTMRGSGHKAVTVNGTTVFFASTGHGGRRSVLNVRSEINRALTRTGETS